MNVDEVIRKVTPLTEASFYILAALSEPLHGYGIMQKVMELTRGRVQLGPGTLYGALTNLQSMGLIESLDNTGTERKKLYCTTYLGRQVVEYEIDRLEEVVKHGRMLLRMEGKNGSILRETDEVGP
ncbi:MAG: PadR family transcriptional regulator [Anaerolineaceae bacterium]|nr:PadR family transcriptional regulator [Anaerolineaceae bacterium]